MSVFTLLCPDQKALINKNKNTLVSSIEAWDGDLPDAEFVIVHDECENMLTARLNESPFS